jgi:type VI secretion system protein ImpM
MSAAVTATIAPAAPGLGATGFYGKIPSRGDFVQTGLPRSFVEPWHDWMQRMLAASRPALGEAWIPAWLEAPVWRFALMPDVCGPSAVLGLWLPSVDRVGRYFPLTVAAVTAEGDLARLVLDGGGFLAAAEDAGRQALASDLPPAALAARIAAATAAPPADPGIDPMQHAAARALWWTEGAPRVAPEAFGNLALPGEAAFAAMLDGALGVPT